MKVYHSKNTSLSTLAILSILLGYPVSGADSNASLAMRDSAKHEELSQKLRMARQKDPIRGLGPEIGKSDTDPSLTHSNRDLVKDSAILCFRGIVTLIPKQSVLHVPDLLKERFKEQNNVKIVPWSDFLKANRGWIRTLEVSREQAMGQVPLPAETLAAYQTGTTAVIATFNGGPISVIPLKEKTESSDSETATKKKTES